MSAISASDLALQRVVSDVAADRGGLLVELGSGSGRIARVLVDAGFSNILALDSDPWAGRQVDGVPGVRFARVDLATEHIPVDDGGASCVVAVHVIEHLDRADEMLTEVHRVLRPGGALVVVTPDFARAMKSFYEDRTHVRPYVAASLRDALIGNGFTVRRLTHCNVRRPFGRLPFLWRRVPPLLFSGNALLAVAVPVDAHRR